MAADPEFLTVPRLHSGQVSAANTNRDGTGTLVTIATGSGSYKEQIIHVAVIATVTTTAGMVRLFLSADGGTTKRLWDELPVAAVTVSATTPAFRTARHYNGLYLPDANALLYASTHNAEAINVVASGLATA